MNNIIHYLYDYINFLEWRDYLEISLFILGSYKISSWLNKGSSKKLLLYLYCYLGLLITSYYIPLPTLWTVLVISGPVVAICVLIAHQDTITKQLITPARLIKVIPHCWTDELIKALLKSMNSGNNSIYIIEKNDDLTPLLKVSLPISCPINAQVLVALIESKQFEHKNIILLRADGILVGINCLWTFGIEENTVDKSFIKACIVSSKNDCLAFKTNATDNSFDVVIKNNVVKAISSSGLRAILNQYLGSSKEQTHEKHIS